MGKRRSSSLGSEWVKSRTDNELMQSNEVVQVGVVNELRWGQKMS